MAGIFSKNRQSANYLFPIIEATLEQADIIFLYLDKELRPMMCNKSVEQITGYRREELFKGDWLELFFRKNPSRKEIFKAFLNSSLTNVSSRIYESSITKRDGSECVLFWRNKAITDASGNIWGLLCAAQDITERKSSEDDLAIQSERLRGVFAGIKDYALLTTNMEDKIIYYGTGTAKLFGWEADMTLKDISILFKEEDRHNIKERVKTSIAYSGKFEQELTLLRTNGKPFPAIFTAGILYDKQNQKAGYIYIIRDITDLKNIERQMVQSEKMAAVGQLAAGIAHEINNPLLVILGRLDMLSLDGEIKDPSLKQTADIIKTQAQRMRVIVDRLLSYSRKKAPRMDMVDVNDILKTIAPLIAYYPEFKKVIWEEELGGELPKVKGDFNQLQELFLNLALNACQAMPQGGTITISSKYARSGFVEIIIRDTGVGIPKDNINKLFTPFFTTKDSGTGLGLAICHSIINSHGGKIEVESEINKGAIFKIKLPIKDKE
jgi:PAS domain S-box-containing protein